MKMIKTNFVWVYNIFPKYVFKKKIGHSLGYLPYLMQPINSKLTSSEMEPGLIEQGESYSMQYCESHVKEQENLLQKKQNIMPGSLSSLEGSGRPKASSWRDDHLLKFTVLKHRKRSLQKLSAEFTTSENKTLSRKTISRRLYNAGFVSRRCI